MKLFFAGSSCAMLLLAGLAGCTGRAALLPNPDPMLQKPNEKFAADAAKRFPFKDDAPRGQAADAPARAEVHYDLYKRINVLNLSETEYKDVEIWINRKYVVFLPRMEPGKLKQLDFKMIYDNEGNYFALNKDMPHIDQIEMLKDGHMYPISMQLAD